MSPSGPTVADLGEHEVLRRLHRFCAPAVGDDGAVQSLPAGEQLVVTTDVLVDDVHFCDRTLPPLALGWRAAAVNLSDLAAMGAAPVGLTVGLTLPEDTSWAWLEQVYQGLGDCLGQYGGAIIGGELCRGKYRSLASTALGSVPRHRALYRSRAQTDQTLVTTGAHGASRAGLALLQEDLEPTDKLDQAWIKAHQRPVPRFDAVAILRGLDCGGAIAVMDTSDGLADAGIQICTQSGVGAALLRSTLPIPPGLVEAVGRSTAERWTLYGGEDFELVLCLPPDRAVALLSDCGDAAAIVGTVTAGREVLLVEHPDDPSGLPLTWDSCFQHF